MGKGLHFVPGRHQNRWGTTLLSTTSGSNRNPFTLAQGKGPQGKALQKQTQDHGNQMRGNWGIEAAVTETKLPPLALGSPVVSLICPVGFLVSASLTRDHFSLFTPSSLWETAEPTTSWLVVCFGSNFKKERIEFLANQLNKGRLGTNMAYLDMSVSRAY